MLLENKNAVIYGVGATGGAVARAFAREGARVFLTGRDRAAVDGVAQEISAAGGAVAEQACNVARIVGLHASTYRSTQS